MIAFFTTLRLKQTYRMFAEIGIGMLLILLFLVGIMTLALLAKLEKVESIYWAFLIGFPAISVHFARKDVYFLKHINIKKQFIYSIEYLLLSIPLVITMAFFQKPTTLLLGILYSVGVSFLPQWKIKINIKTYDFTFIPLSLYEWRIGFRKNAWSFFFIYFLAFAAAKFEGTILIFALLSAMTISPFYDCCEPKEWFLTNFSLWKRVRNHLLAWSIFILPHLLLFEILHADLWYLGLIAWYFGAMCTAFYVVYKYAAWSPFRTKIGMSAASSIFVAMMVVVFTSPACIFAIGYYWKKANRNIGRLVA